MNTASTRRKFSWRSAFIWVIGAGVLAIILSIFIQTRAWDTYFASAISPQVAGIGSSFEAPGKPARLIIPSIGVDAHIQSVGLSWRGNGEMGVPTNFTDVAWYKDGPRPGMPGSAVIDGHVDGKDVPQAVFYDLDKLQKGDEVRVVDEDGRVLVFRVVDIKVYDYEAPTSEIFSADASKMRLNLITCVGDWIESKNLYDERLIVFTELVA
ncbi:MAG: class F sortase [Patescibacteria group bacterium]|nr:class F sortase [Patescibacteria group bacterium]